jgi:hypothetical protein
LATTTYTYKQQDLTTYRYNYLGNLKSGYPTSSTINGPYQADSDGRTRYTNLVFYQNTSFKMPQPYTRSRDNKLGFSGITRKNRHAGGDLWVYERVGNLIAGFTSPDWQCEIPTTTSNMIRRAETEALNKLRSYAVNYGVALAEIGKSTDLIAGTAKKLYGAYRYARKGNLRACANKLGLSKHKFKSGASPASGWLELQYGWLPLASDIYGASVDLQTYKEHLYRDNMFKVTRNVSEKIQHRYTQAVSGKDIIRFSQSGNHGVKVRLDYKVDHELLAKACSMGLTNPAEIVWELVPFSFIVDWGLPIGNYLSAIPNTLGLTFVAGSKTVFTKFKTIGTCFYSGGQTDPLGTSAEYFTYIQAGASRDYVQMNRTVYDESPSPSLYIKNPISTQHALNAAALMRSLWS